MRGLAGRVALITGGASGIGAGLVRAFVEQGVNVAFCDIQESAGQALAQELGDGATYFRSDIRVDSEIDALLASTMRQYGQLDFLINAAATYTDRGLDSDRNDWLNGFNTNLIGHAMLLKAALEHLKASKNASVVNFTSEAAHAGLSGRWVYPATKAAIEQFTRSAALDLAEYGIRVNAVMPGWTEKPWHKTAPAEVVSHYNQMAGRLHMLGRMGTVSEVADAALFLCSEHASFITGSNLRVDGGHSALGPQGRERHLPTVSRAAAGVVFQP